MCLISLGFLLLFALTPPPPTHTHTQIHAYISLILCTHMHTHTHTCTQWYVSSISGPKAIYLVIDSTNPEEFSLMQLAALDILSTVTHRDFFNVHFSTGSNPGFSDSLVRADNSTREQISAFIWNHEVERQQVNLSLVFSYAYEAFEQGGFTTCHRIVILFSDSSLDQELPRNIDKLRENVDLIIDIYTYSFGSIAVNPTIAQEIACANNGEWFQISSA